MIHTPILLSKCISPIPSPTYMRRASLVKKLKYSERVQLTILHGGAGYGKSSSLAAYFNDSRSIYTWYSVTEEDDNVLPFMTYLIHSIQRSIPHFGRSLEDFNYPSMFPKEQDLQQWIALLINELCEIDESTSIVIDDFHLVDHVFQVNFLMEKIIEFLPPHIHLIVSTRNRPRWTSLTKMKLTGQLNEITEEDFMFSEEEIGVFFEDYFYKTITVEEAKNIAEITEGWAIAINLLATQLADSPVSISPKMKPALVELFAYLSEEVFNNMQQVEQHALLSYSIFPVFSVQLIEDFFSIELANLLKELTSRHVFIQPLGEEGTYRYHALFQEFLEAKWQQVDPSQFTDTHQRAAKYYQSKNNPGQAIYHAIKSKQDKFIAEMLVETGASLVKAGQFDWLLDTIQELSQSVRDVHYPLHYFEGEAHRYRAFYEKARLAYIKCIQLAIVNEDAYFVSRANAGIAHIYLDTIQPGMAEPFLIDAIAYARKSVQTNFREMAMLKRQFAENLVNLGRAKDASAWVENEALDHSILREGNLDARILLRTGNLREAQALLIDRSINKSNLPDSHRDTDVLLSLIYSMIGKIDQSMESATKGIELGEREKSGFVEAVGWIRMGHAKVLHDPYETIVPEQLYIRAIQRMDELNVSRGKAEPYMGLSILKARQGYYSEAINYGEKGLVETEKVNDGWLSGLIRIGLAIVHFYAENYEECIAYANSAKLLFEECGDTYGEMVTTFWLMNATLAKGEDSQFATYAKSFAELCVRHEFYFFLLTETIFCPFDMESISPLLIHAGKLNPEHPETEQLLQRLNLSDISFHPGYKIDVQLIGHFTIHLGLEEVDDRKWARDKAKELFIYLLLHKDRYVAKEEITRVLWGETEDKNADRDFRVALNALLKVLEPHRNPRDLSFFILRKQVMYRLNPVAQINSDLERFRQYAENGLSEKNPSKAIEKLLKAASLYKGQLFEEKLSVEWLDAERDSLNQQYLEVIERLAQTYTRVQEFGKTVYWAEKLLRIDPTWEEAYRLLMFASYQLKNRPLAVKWYTKCVSVLNDELNIEPMETTEQMYKMIMEEF